MRAVVQRASQASVTVQGRAVGAIDEPGLLVLVGAVVQALRDLGARVQTGVFGADMKVSLINDGPVTIVIDL
jgi:D-aminoacyl-tRNA deacylase